MAHLTDKGKRGKINEILEREEEIAMAAETLIHISKDEIEFARLTSELKYELDNQSRMVNAERRGRNERSLEIAKKLKAAGISDEIIFKTTGLNINE